MSRFNTQTSHPLIPNSQEYQFEQQYISIHSEDRNILKYPNASEFEIQLPQDYQNVQGFRLASGCFPVNFTMFSPKSKNVTMTFQITKPYDATQLVPLNPIQTKILSIFKFELFFLEPFEDLSSGLPRGSLLLFSFQGIILLH